MINNYLDEEAKELLREEDERYEYLRRVIISYNNAKLIAPSYITGKFATINRARRERRNVN